MLAISAVLLSCQAPQTRILETHANILAPLIRGASEPIILTDQTLVIDARKSFDYQMSHISQSINVTWPEFNGENSRSKTFIKKDLQRMARRLSKYGLTPNTEVIVVDEGYFGGGEAGRVAWSLFYMGIKNVQATSIELLRKKLGYQSRQRLKSAAVWLPNYRKQLLIQKSELKAKRNLSLKRYIIDVREKGETHKHSIAGSIHIPLSSFLNKWGRPDKKINKYLSSRGITKKDELILVSPLAVRSAAGVMSLLSLGYQRVSHLDGGYVDLNWF